MALSGSQRPMRVLGIDPGLTRCGLGVVDGTPGRALTMIEVGVARTPADDDISQRLLALEREFEAWMTTHQPDAVAVERPGDVGRLGGDEFMVVLPDIGSSENAAQVAERLITTLQAPMTLSNQSFMLPRDAASIPCSDC